MPKMTLQTRTRPDKLDRVLREAARRIGDLTPAYKRASVFLDQWVQRNFKTEGALVGGWPPFAMGGRFVPGHGIDAAAKLLQDTGRLRLSFKPFATRRNAGIRSELPYAEAHEKGTKRLPQRRMLPERSEVEDDLEDILLDHALDATRPLRR